MTRRRLLLILAILLAAAWTSWLAYEAYTAGDPIVVSRPQLLAAPVIVEGELVVLAQGGPGIHIKQVYRGRELLPGDPNGPGGLIVTVDGLPEGASGDAILALRLGLDAAFELVPTPRSPGHAGGRPLLYPANESTREQVRQALGIVR